MRWIIAAPSLALALAVPRIAAACTPIPTDALVLDPAYADDAAAPAAVTADAPIIDRQEASGCAGAASCGDQGLILIAVTATDDRAPTPRLGYQLDVVGGRAPAHYWPDGQAVVAEGGTLYLRFDPDARGFEFDLAIRAVDLNGNVGPATVVHVADPDSGAGCAAGGHHRASTALAVALAGLLARRRRG